jgi:hypothetical protein
MQKACLRHFPLATDIGRRTRHPAQALHSLPSIVRFIKMNLTPAIMGIKFPPLEVVSIFCTGTAFLSSTSGMSIANPTAHFDVHIDTRAHPIS